MMPIAHSLTQTKLELRGWELQRRTGNNYDERDWVGAAEPATSTAAHSHNLEIIEKSQIIPYSLPSENSYGQIKSGRDAGYNSYTEVEFYSNVEVTYK